MADTRDVHVTIRAADAEAFVRAWNARVAHDVQRDLLADMLPRTACIDADRLAARKVAEARIEVVFEQLDTDEQLALLFRLLRARGWSTDRANTVLAKARWNG